MKTEKLTEINLSSKCNFNEIEEFLGQEIDCVYNYRVDYHGIITIAPGSVIFEKNFPCYHIRPFTMINRNYKFDFERGILEIEGRDKWKRKFSKKFFQFAKVGYKLRTKHKPEGYIWGNPMEIDI
jgi:hypothetical protein